MESPRIGPPPVVAVESQPNRIARPAWAVIAGLIGLMAAEFALPWATVHGQPIVDGRTEPDGAITLVLGVLILAFAVSRSATESDSRLVQAAPGLLGLSILATAFDAFQATSTTARYYSDLGNDSALGIGMAVEVAGCVAVALGGAAAAVLAFRAAATRHEGDVANRQAARPWLGPDWVDPDMVRLVPDRNVLATVAAAGAVVGGVIAIWAAGAVGAVDSSGARLAGLTLAGILMGPVVTVWLWRRLAERRS
jgi:hypothetical protein